MADNIQLIEDLKNQLVLVMKDNEKLREKVKVKEPEFKYEYVIGLKEEISMLKAKTEKTKNENKISVQDTSFNLNFESTPKLIYVSKHGKFSSDTLLIDGKIIKGIVSFNLFGSLDEPTRHTVEYNTCQAE